MRLDDQVLEIDEVMGDGKGRLVKLDPGFDQPVVKLIEQGDHVAVSDEQFFCSLEFSYPFWNIGYFLSLVDEVDVFFTLPVLDELKGIE